MKKKFEKIYIAYLQSKFVKNPLFGLEGGRFFPISGNIYKGGEPKGGKNITELLTSGCSYSKVSQTENYGDPYSLDRGDGNASGSGLFNLTGIDTNKDKDD